VHGTNVISLLDLGINILSALKIDILEILAASISFFILNDPKADIIKPCSIIFLYSIKFTLLG